MRCNLTQSVIFHRTTGKTENTKPKNERKKNREHNEVKNAFNITSLVCIRPYSLYVVHECIVNVIYRSIVVVYEMFTLSNGLTILINDREKSELTPKMPLCQNVHTIK